MKKLVLNAVGFPNAASDIERYRNILERSFPHHKVAALPVGHRLRRLWNREDHIAACELLALAYGIENSEKISKSWTNMHIKHIVSHSKNGQIGSTFELNAAAMLFHGGCNVKCGAKNSPGYDLEVPFGDEKVLFLSLKNHDQSDTETAFQDRCAKFRARAIEILGARAIPAYIRIEAKGLPTEEDWQAIEQLLPGLPFNGQVNIATHDKIDIRTMKLHPLNGQTFAPGPFSYLFVVNSSSHAREQQNFSSNLEKAAFNMKQHLSQRQNALKVVFMRVHATANLTMLEETATKLLNSAEIDYGIDGVILYQTAIIRDKQTFSISHCLKIVSSSRWDTNKYGVKLCPFVGVQINKPSKLVLQYDGLTKSEQTQDYFFQEGDYYHEWTLQEGSSNITNPAPGVHTHLVMQGQPFSGKIFPAQDNLLLI